MKKESRVYRLAGFAVAIGILLGLIHHSGFHRFFGIILHASPAWLAVSMVVYAMSWALRTWRLGQLTSHVGATVKPYDLFRLHIAGYALNAVLPAKLGDAATVAYLRTHDVRIGRSAAIVFQTRLLDAMAILLLGAPSLVLLLEHDHLAGLLSAAVACAVLVAAPMIIVRMDRKGFVVGVLDAIANRCRRKLLKLVLDKAKDAYNACREILLDRSLLASSLLLSLLIWLLDALTCHTVAVAVGAEASLFPIIIAVSLANLGKSVPVTPGGTGVYEGIVALVLVMFGISFDVALAIGIMDHTLKKLFNLACGIPAAMQLGVSLKKLREMTNEASAG